MAYKIKPDLFTSKLNILIYGEPGAGKTYLAGTAQDVPEMRNVRFFNIDGGLMTLAYRGDIEAIDVRTEYKNGKMTRSVLDILEKERWKIAGQDPDYKDVKTIVLDNISELQTLTLEEITHNQYEDRKKKINSYTVDDVYLEDYKKSTAQLSRILRGYRDLPVHVVFVAHKQDKYKKSPDGKDTTILEESKPKLTDKLATAIMGYQDFVWPLIVKTEIIDVNGKEKQELNRYLLTQPLSGYFAKTREGIFASRLGALVKNPTFPAIWNTFQKTGGTK